MAKLSETQCLNRSKDYDWNESQIARLLPTRDKLFNAREDAKKKIQELKAARLSPSLPSDGPSRKVSRNQLYRAFLESTLDIILQFMLFGNESERQQKIRDLEYVLAELNRNLGETQSKLDHHRERMNALDLDVRNGGCKRILMLTPKDPAMIERSKKR